jgi:hypothetical protein
MKLNSFILSALAATNLAQADLLSTSLVRTPTGECLASTLKKGAVVLALDRSKKKLVSSKVTHIEKATTDTMYSFDTEDGTINAVPGQTLYDTQRKKWIHAHEVTLGSSLLDCQKRPTRVIRVNEQTGQFETVRISVEDPHVLFADGVLTHNLSLLILVASGGAKVYASAAAAQAALAAGGGAIVTTAVTNGVTTVAINAALAGTAAATTVAATTASTAAVATGGGIVAAVSTWAVAHPILAGGTVVVGGHMGQTVISRVTNGIVDTVWEKVKKLYHGKSYDDGWDQQKNNRKE